jgi:hypothetical protein
LLTIYVHAAVAVAGIRTRLGHARQRPDAGYNTEAVIVIALLAAAAITVVGIITVKIRQRANSIDLGP